MEYYVRDRECYRVAKDNNPTNSFVIAIVRSFDGVDDWYYHILDDDLQLSKSFEDNIKLSRFLYDTFGYIEQIGLDQFLKNINREYWEE